MLRMQRLAGALLALTMTLSGSAHGHAAEADRGRVIEVRVREYRFTPENIEVKRGERVTLRLINEGTERHEWEIESLDVEIEPVQPGGSAELTLVAPKKAGQYEYICDLEDHHEQGMKGIMTVR